MRKFFLTPKFYGHLTLIWSKFQQSKASPHFDETATVPSPLGGRMSLLEADHSTAVILHFDQRHFFSCHPGMSGHISERVPFLVSFPINAKQILSEDFSIGFLLLWIRWLCGCEVVRCHSDADHPESAQTPQVGAQSPVRWPLLQTPSTSWVSPRPPHF